MLRIWDLEGIVGECLLKELAGGNWVGLFIYHHIWSGCKVAWDQGWRDIISMVSGCFQCG